MSDHDPHLSETAHIAGRESFSRIERYAREVLKDRGLSDDQINDQLNRAMRVEDPPLFSSDLN